MVHIEVGIIVRSGDHECDSRDDPIRTLTPQRVVLKKIQIALREGKDCKYNLFSYQKYACSSAVSICKSVDIVLWILVSLLGTFAKFRKATICYVTFFLPSVRPSVCAFPLDSHRTDFHEIS